MQRSAIVLVIDRLGAGFVGPYGNTWIDTPHWNRLAAGSLLFEFAMADRVELDTAYRSYWYGCHAVAQSPTSVSLPQRWQAASLHTALLTDEPTVAELPAADFFDERICLSPPAATVAADSIEATEMAHIFAAMIDWLESAPEPFVLWVHSRGMQSAWDAPLDFRNAFADEDEPLPPEFVEPPRRLLDEQHDPDELLGLVHAYAGQVKLTDMCLGVLLDACEAMLAQRNVMLAVTSPRGYPLGEHRRVGPGDDVLHGESLHVPLMLRFPQQQNAAQRDLSLVQPADVAATLAEWLHDERPSMEFWGRSLLKVETSGPPSFADRAMSIGAARSAFRTPAWLLVDGGDQVELYAKPDDRWEANEVSDRCHEVVQAMQQEMAAFQRAAQANDRGRLAPLPSILVEG